MSSSLKRISSRIGLNGKGELDYTPQRLALVPQGQGWPIDLTPSEGAVTDQDRQPVALEAAVESVETRSQWMRQALLIGLLALVLNLVGNQRVGLWDRDEPRYAVAVREMRERGDWVAPTFNGEPRYHKPIFIYWVMGLSTSIFGDNTFGARFGSAMAGTGSALLCFWLARQLVGKRAGFLAALILVTAPLMVTESKMATTDATLAFLLLITQTCLWILNQKDDAKVAFTFWLAMGLAVLTKGPVGPALVAAAGLASWWFGGPSVCWKRLRWRWGLGLLALITLPWFITIGVRSQGDFFRFAVGKQLINRVTSKLEDHGGFPGYYFVFVMITFYPWSCLVPASLAAAWSRRKTSPTLGFLLGWVIGPLIPLELMQTKLIHYYLPALPALAILVGWFLELVASDVMSIRRWAFGRLGLGMLAGIAIALTAGMIAGGTIFDRNLIWPCLALAVIMATGSLTSLNFYHRGATILGSRTLIGCWALFILTFAGWLLPAAEGHRISRIVGEKLARHADNLRAKPVLVTFQEPNIIYAMKRTAPTLRNWDAVAETLKVNRKLVAPITPEQLTSLQQDGRFELNVLETIDGFNVNKGKTEDLRIAQIVIKKVASSLARSAPEQPLVK
jgi:4-amino-4-deoxy-L-arabinose transferase-like glycosyltransferase